MNKKEILSAFEFRQATKRFDAKKKISDEDFNFLIDVASLSPTSFGLEPYKMVVVQNEELRQGLKAISWGAQGQLNTETQASHYVMYLAYTKKKMFDTGYFQDFMKNVQKLNDESRAFKTKLVTTFVNENFELTDERRFTDWASRQIYIVMGNMMSTAAMIGVESCPIEGFEREKTITFLKEKMNIDTTLYTPAVMCAFGYRANGDITRPKTRRDKKEIIEWLK